MPQNSLPPLCDPDGNPINDEHPALGLLPPHVLKHVTMRAEHGEYGLSEPGRLASQAEADSSVGGKGKQGAAGGTAVKPRAARGNDAEAAQQGRTLRKRHNREALAAMSKGDWEERIAYLQYELTRPSSAGAAQAVGKTSRYRRWGRLGATSHLNALSWEEEGPDAGAGKQKRARKKREARKAALPSVPVRRGPRTGGGRAAHRRRGGLDQFGSEDQRVLTQVYLGAVEPPLRRATEQAEEEPEREAQGGGRTVWFRDRVATPNDHEYLAV